MALIKQKWPFKCEKVQTKPIGFYTTQCNGNESYNLVRYVCNISRLPCVTRVLREATLGVQCASAQGAPHARTSPIPTLPPRQAGFTTDGGDDDVSFTPLPPLSCIHD